MGCCGGWGGVINCAPTTVLSFQARYWALLHQVAKSDQLATSRTRKLICAFHPFKGIQPMPKKQQLHRPSTWPQFQDAGLQTLFPSDRQSCHVLRPSEVKVRTFVKGTCAAKNFVVGRINRTLPPLTTTEIPTRDIMRVDLAYGLSQAIFIKVTVRIRAYTTTGIARHMGS